MKKILLLVIAAMFATASFAQQLDQTQFATLNHDGSISTYYGYEALRSALNSAQHGDIITLSPGIFNAPGELTKAVTIRGAGMMRDTVANNDATTIQYSFTINVPNENYTSGHHLKIEGIFFNGHVLYNSAVSPSFNRCRFVNSIRRHDYGGTFYLPVFTNCIIPAWDGSTCAVNPMFVNCIILNSWTGTGRTGYTSNSSWTVGEYNSYYERGRSYDVYYNCIVNIPPSYTSYKRQIINSIIYSDSISQSTGTNVFNTIGITDSTDYFATIPNNGNNNVNGFESIFKTFRGTYANGETFELTPTAAATYLGTDGTQVGIYGGSAVYNTRVIDPRIRKYIVDFYSDENGQLKITTELENE